MNPAYSVILFTTASGAGYGLLALCGLVGFNHGPASSVAFALTGTVLALVLIAVGLLSSTLHLGRPERAWRAFSQWRSSWLSREGILAVVTYPFALMFAAAWAGFLPEGFVAPLGLITAALCAATVFATGKIYSTLVTIPAWNSNYTVTGYLMFALSTGGVLLGVVSTLFGRLQIFQIVLAIVALLLTMLVKFLYWADVKTKTLPTTGQATGLGDNVRQWEVPHTNVNFIQKEMGYVVARKHAEKLRVLIYVLLAVAALFCLLAGFVASGFIFVAGLAVLAAAVFERWLFFAEARHIVSAYYAG